MSRWKDAALHLAAALFVLSPLLPATILASRNDDLANHVRFVDEARQAWREGQFPPLTTVGLHDGVRLPLFQFYSGSAYLLPGLLGFAVDPYTALRLTLVLTSALAGFALRRALARVGASPGGALLGALALQLAPFGVVDLQQRGAYPEWLALHLGALLFALLATLALAARPPAWLFACASACAAAFVAAHPLQTAAIGPLVALLVVGAWRDARAAWRSLAWAAAAGVSGVALAAFYWLPIAASWGEQKMPTRRGVFDAAGVGLVDVFWPWARGPEGFALQLGAPLVVGLLAPLVVLRLLRGRLHALALAFGLGAALIAAGAEPINAHLPGLAHALRHYQTAFRFLAPASLCASIALALTLSTPRFGRRAAAVAALLVVVHAAGYVFPARSSARPGSTHDVETVTAPEFRVPNASFYALVGTDLRELGWIDAGGDLRLREPLPLPRAGLPFRARLHTVGAADLRVALGPLESAAPAEAPGVFVFDVRPVRQFLLRFTSSSPRVRVARLELRPDGDAEWLTTPRRVVRLPRATPGWSARVQVERAGLVQLPVAFVPWDRAFVDGAPAAHASRDRFLWVVRLPAGESGVSIERAFPRAAEGLTAVGLLGTLLGAWALARRRGVGV